MGLPGFRSSWPPGTPWTCGRELSWPPQASPSPPTPTVSCRYSQSPQGAQLAEGVGSDFPDEVVLEASRAARQAE